MLRSNKGFIAKIAAKDLFNQRDNRKNKNSFSAFSNTTTVYITLTRNATGRHIIDPYIARLLQISNAGLCEKSAMHCIIFMCAFTY